MEFRCSNDETTNGVTMPFKRCSLCDAVWETRDEFLGDPDLQLNGYQFTSRNLTQYRGGGLLLYTHRNRSCGTTLALSVRKFKENVIQHGGTGEE